MRHALLSAIASCCCTLGVWMLYPNLLARWSHTHYPAQEWHGNGNVMAVVVPVYDGDINDAMLSLSKWPTTCSENMRNGMDLVIYKAETLGNADQLPRIPRQASGCFRRTKFVGGGLLPEVWHVAFLCRFGTGSIKVAAESRVRWRRTFDLRFLRTPIRFSYLFQIDINAPSRVWWNETKCYNLGMPMMPPDLIGDKCSWI